MITVVTHPDWTSVITAIGTVLVAVVAVGIALWSEWKADKRIAEERKRSDERLAEERALSEARIREERRIAQEAFERQRIARREERLEVAAGRVRQLLGLTGSLLEGRIDEAWDGRDAESLRDHAHALGDIAQQAYHEMETVGDELEIYVAVVMAEAWQLADEALRLAELSSEDWDRHATATHLSIIKNNMEQIQRRLNELVDPPRP